MATIDVYYEGDLRTRCVHCATQTEITTDAPKDNQGLGRVFSPTDLVVTALGSCILTIMGIAAKKLNVDLKGTRAAVTKEMENAPLRRIKKISIVIRCPFHFSEHITEQLIKAADTCPVTHSLHPDIEKEISFFWKK